MPAFFIFFLFTWQFWERFFCRNQNIYSD